jgi:hypothetical protein
MKRVAISGAIIFILGLGTALLGIYAPPPGAEPTRRGLTKLVVFLIAIPQALWHTGDPHLKLLYVGLGTMFVGLDMMLTSLIAKFWIRRKRH